MFLYYVFHYLPLAALIGVLIAIVHYVRSRRAWDISLIAASSIALVLSILLLGSSILQTRYDYVWSAQRLAPILSWVYGGKLYYPQGQGPLLVRIYGPISSLVYLPVALARRPTQALYIGAAINFVLMVVPLIWLLIRCSTSQVPGSTMTRTSLLPAIAGFGLVACLGSILYEFMSMVTIDGPAIGFAACACAVLIGPSGSSWKTTSAVRRGILCGLFAGLSVWDKQTMWPMVPALLIYALLSGGYHRGARCASVMTVTIGVFSAWMLMLFGAEAMWFNMLIIPSSQPWYWPELSTPAALLRAGRMIWRDSWFVGELLVSALLLQAIASRRWTRADRETGAIRDDRRWAQRNAWILPLMVSLFVLPTTAAAYAKIGGRANNSAETCCFALVAALSIFIQFFSDVRSDMTTMNASHSTVLDRFGWRARLARGGFIAVLVVLVWLPASRDDLRDLPHRLVQGFHPRPTSNEIAFDYCRAHPGEIYFPYYPLASLLAEHRAYHHDGGVWDLIQAGFQVSPTQLAQGLPPHMRAIGFDTPRPLGEMPRLLKQYSKIIHPPDLPANWILLVRPNDSGFTGSSSTAPSAR